MSRVIVKTSNPYRSRASHAHPGGEPSSGVKLWQLLLAGLGLLTTLLFLLGAGVTQMVFWLWGLDFLLIASRDDVARAGVSLLLRTSPLIAVGAAAAFSAWHHKGPGWRKYLAGCLVAVALMTVSIPFGKSVPWLAISPFVAAIAAMMVGVVVLRRGPGERVDGVRWTGFAALFSIAVFLSSIAPAAEIAAGGYFDHRVQPLRQAAAAAANAAATSDKSQNTKTNPNKDQASAIATNACDNYLIWIGDKAMVLDCDRAAPMSRLKLIYGAHDFEAQLDRRLRPRTLWSPPSPKP